MRFSVSSLLFRWGLDSLSVAESDALSAVFSFLSFGCGAESAAAFFVLSVAESDFFGGAGMSPVRFHSSRCSALQVCWLVGSNSGCCVVAESTVVTADAAVLMGLTFLN